jgi:hypothetical protein
MQSPLSRSVNIYTELRERIARAYDLEADDPTLLDTLDGETDLSEQIVRTLKAAKESAALAEGLQAYIDELHVRRKRLDDRSDRLRAIAAWAMQECGLKKIEAPEMTITMRAVSQGVAIAGEVPREFCKVKETLSPDKAAIKSALESGQSLSFAYMTQGEPSISVRIK